MFEGRVCAADFLLFRRSFPLSFTHQHHTPSVSSLPLCPLPTQQQQQQRRLGEAVRSVAAANKEKALLKEKLKSLAQENHEVCAVGSERTKGMWLFSSLCSSAPCVISSHHLPCFALTSSPSTARSCMPSSLPVPPGTVAVEAANDRIGDTGICAL